MCNEPAPSHNNIMWSERKHSLLLVEDNPSTQAALARLFRSEFEVIAAESPKQALELLRNGLIPSIIFSDYIMPEMSGLEFLQEAMVLSPSSMRIILTGHLAIQDLTKAMHEQILHRVLMKPWENDLLLFQMQEILVLHEVFKEKHQLKKLAITDSITGLFNHRHFQASIQNEVARALRYSHLVSLALIDVDFLKNVNDSKGHPMGDQVLKEVAELLKNGVRTTDVVCRYGGDEFAIILPHTDAQGAKELAEKIRIACNQSTSPLLSGITLSLGVSTLEGKINDTRLLIESADQALYHAKRNGKNQTVVADTSNIP